MKLDLSCPIECQTIQCAQDDRGAMRAYLRMFNLSTRTVRAFDAEISWDADGSRIVTRLHASDLDWPSRRRLSRAVTIKDPRVVGVRWIRVVKISFAEGYAPWIARADRFVDYPDPPAPKRSQLMDKLSRLSGGAAVCFAAQHSAGWRCICGRWNLPQRPKCLRCRREKAVVLKRYTPAAVRTARVSSRAAPDPKRPLDRHSPPTARDRWQSQRRARLQRTLALTLLALLLLAFAKIIRASR